MGYLFEVLSPKTRIPNVIILLGLGMVCKELAILGNWNAPNFSSVLPELGTIGLILIVLEGSLELKLTKDKKPLLIKTSLLAFLSILTLAVGLSLLFTFQGYTFQQSIVNSIPLAIISSAIAIPTAKMLSSNDKEFVIFESSLSDIIGVTVFNFLIVNTVINFNSFTHFALEIGISILFSVIGAILLIIILNRLKHKIKFIPIIALILMLYAIAKGLHLPALILILVFGLVVGNIERITQISFLKQFNPSHLIREIHRFEEITTELTFVVRVAFFVIFGFTIDVNTILEINTLLLSLSIFAMILILRVLLLLILRLPVFPLAFIAPRGLITILLFVNIPLHLSIDGVNQTIITQVILLTALFMMFATIFVKKPVPQSTL